MRVLVTFAVDAEFAPWRKLGGFRKIDPLYGPSAWYGHRDVYETVISQATVRVVLTGMGWWNAGRAMELSYKNFLPDYCLSSGFAGSLKPEHQPGDILVAQRIAEVRGKREMVCDAELVRLAVRKGAKRVDCFLGSKRIVSTSDEKGRLGFWGDAVEIESFRVLAAARGRGIPAVAVRGISDGSDTDLPYDFLRAADHTGQMVVARLLRQIVRNPAGIGALLKLASASRLTAERLARFLQGYVSELAVREVAQEVAAR